MQKYNATVISTTGAPGTGKSYSRCARFLYDVWLPEEKGVHWSNFPVNFEAFEKKFPDVRERVKIIPAEELAEWMKGEGRGPWDFFTKDMLENSHVAIDECHLYIKKTGKGCQVNAERWMKWLGDIRHWHCSVEFLSQDPHKVNKCVEIHSSVRIQLINSEDRRDPIFNILLGDWYELRASFGREYETVIWQMEERRIAGKWVTASMKRFTLDPQYFPLYNSYNNTQATTSEEASAPPRSKQREFQKRSIPGLWFWFVRRNFWNLSSRAVAACLMLWLCFFGGMTYVINGFNHYCGMMAASNRKAGESLKTKSPETGSDVPDQKNKGPKAKKPLFQTVEEKPPQVPVKTPPSSPAEGPAVPVAVRSETLSHHSLEKPPSAEAQQRALPRLNWLSREFVALDDGQMCRVGDPVGSFVLMEIDYKKRLCVFEGIGDEEGLCISVPVGGPVGVRRVPKPEASGAAAGLGAAFKSVVP